MLSDIVWIIIVGIVTMLVWTVSGGVACLLYLVKYLKGNSDREVRVTIPETTTGEAMAMQDDDYAELRGEENSAVMDSEDAGDE